MANTGNISMAPALAAIQTDITAIMGPGWNPATDALENLFSTLNDARSSVNSIRGIDVPALQAEHLILDNEIGVIDGIADAILIDTDATIPAALGVIDGNVDSILVDTDATLPALIAAKVLRGEFKTASYNAIPGDVNYHDVLNISGSPGKMAVVVVLMDNDNGNIKITVDSEVSNELLIPANTAYFIILDPTATDYLIDKIETYEILMHEFISVLKVEIKQTVGGSNMQCCVFYQDDS